MVAVINVFRNGVRSIPQTVPSGVVSMSFIMMSIVSIKGMLVNSELTNHMTLPILFRYFCSKTERVFSKFTDCK